MRKIRGDRISMIFQEPMTALNPVMKVGDQIAEVLDIHTNLSERERRARVLEVMQSVHLPEPERLIDVYPHQLSGGQRQRIMIAAALVLDPVLLIADEPTTALDVTTQAQILKLIKELRERRNTGVLFITHDFGVVAEVAHRVVVMQHGRVVEQGKTEDVLRRPRDDYTRMLIRSVPSLSPPARDADHRHADRAADQRPHQDLRVGRLLREAPRGAAPSTGRQSARSGAARRSAWSASPAPASRRSRAASRG